MTLQKATTEQIPEIMRVLEACKTVMHGRGLRQWLDGYPSAGDVAKDIADGVGVAYLDGDRVVGYAAVLYDGEPTYAKIDGRWLTDGRYAAIHRVGIDPAVHGTGVGRAFMLAMEEKCAQDGLPSVRLDTHDDNLPMQTMLLRLGLTYCGTIWLEDGAPRRAYERVLTEPVIRPIERRDRGALRAMTAEFYASDAVLHPLPEDCHERNFEEICKPDGQLRGYIFEVGGCAAGFAMLALNWSTEVGGRTVWIEDVYVRESYRSQGIGKAFFRRLDWDYGDDAKRYRLEVEEENVGALHLYKTLGFEQLPYMQMIRDF